MTSLRTIGLLGGSFNPAHPGHMHISREAMRRLKLDAVWWLVSPQNPLKHKADMADYETRLAGARDMARVEKGIVVSDIERELGTRYTVDTLEALAKRYPRTRFVWVMGADNLAQFHRWKHWHKILENYRIIVLDRAPHTHGALRAPAAMAAAKWRVPPGRLLLTPLPAWSYALIRRDHHSSTQIRAYKTI